MIINRMEGSNLLRFDMILHLLVANPDRCVQLLFKKGGNLSVTSQL